MDTIELFISLANLNSRVDGTFVISNNGVKFYNPEEEVNIYSLADIESFEELESGLLINNNFYMGN